MKSSLDFVSVCLKSLQNIWGCSWVQYWLLVNSKPKVCVCVCVFCGCFEVLYGLSLHTCLWPGPKTPTGPQNTHIHIHPLHTGWPDYRARENHLQQRLNYTQTSASCWPLLGQDCLPQVASLTHTRLIQEERADTILATLMEWNKLTSVKGQKLCSQDRLSVKWGQITSLVTVMECSLCHHTIGGSNTCLNYVY